MPHFTQMGGGGLPLVLVHGNAGDRTHWDPVQRLIKTRTVCVEIRGMGQTPAGPRGGYEEGAEDVQAIVDFMGLERFVLAGHSWGGAVVGHYAALHPERLAGLVYLDAAGDMRGMPAEVSAAYFEAFGPETYQAALEQNFSELLREATPATRERVMATARATPREVFVRNMASLLQYDPHAAQKAFQGPTLAIVAKALMGPDTFAAQFPEVPRVELEGVSHWLQLDAPQRVAELLSEFVANCQDAKSVTAR